MLSIAIQGVEASFHDGAARKYFGNDIAIVPCNTFGECFEALDNNQADYAIVAIENSLYGSINMVYDLLMQKGFWISGEVYLRIEQALIGLPNAKLADIKEVYSHPVALAQCEEYLETQLPKAKQFEHGDTATSVADVKTWQDPTKAAIAGQQAAEAHGLKVLAKNIETNKENYTRFVVLQKARSQNTKADKISLVLSTPKDTKPGALYRALGVFASRNLNLLLLHSRPVVGSAWSYLFYLDVEAREDSEIFKSALRELDEQGCEATILGAYQAGKQ